MTRYLVVNGSPLRRGRSVQVAQQLTRLLSHEGSVVDYLNVGIDTVDPCIACNCCKETYQCVLQDRLQPNYPLIDKAEVMIMISPVYFAGPPAQAKAFLDRMQPYFWNEDHRKLKRKAFLFVVREGGDPHGFDPLLTIVKSSLTVAGFRLEEYFDCIDAYGEALETLVARAASRIKDVV